MKSLQWPKDQFAHWNLHEQQDFLKTIATSFPRMFSQLENLKSCPPLWDESFTSQMDLLEEWIFFGGTFDPWHEGHGACLELLQGKKIVVIPDRNPWKATQAMQTKNLCLYLDELSRHLDPRFHAVYPGFLASDQANPTIDWFSQVAGKKSLLIGADNLMSFSRWKDYQKLLGLCETLYVAPRKIGESQSDFDQALEHCRSLGTKVVVLNHHDYEHLSSTELRQK